MNGARLRAWGLCIVLLALSACSTFQAPQMSALLAQPPVGLPAQHELVQTPFFPQEALQCGPAALATALGAAGASVTPEQLTPQLFVPARQGSLQLEMLAAARRQGFVSTRLPPSLSALLREVAAGHPPVVLLNLSLDIYPLWHYAVVVGYDLAAREVLLRSGQTQRMAMPLFTFERTWQRSGHWAFAVLPPGQWPHVATLADVSDAAVAFERAQAGAPAARAYRAALDRWPDDLVLQLGWGNALFASHAPEQAAQAFAQAARQHDSAAAWNNLASVRLSLGQTQAAREAAARAVQRAQHAEPQWLAAAQATLAEIDEAASRLPSPPPLNKATP